MNAAKTLTIAAALLGSALSVGCASLEQAIPQEVRYGKLYSLEERLAAAADDCANPDAVFAGRYWAGQVSHDLGEHMRFLDRLGDPYRKAEGLLASLNRVQYSQGDALCEALSASRHDTQQLLLALAE